VIHNTTPKLSLIPIITVTQGCGSCPTNDTTECQECKEVYCNEESKVYKHCLADNDGICKTPFDAPCYLWRTPTNGGFE